jgi:hypothetical protein
MPRIPEDVVATVVAEVGSKMADPKYAQTQVGAWVQEQPEAARYVSASAGELGGAPGVVTTVFHCTIVAECFRRQAGRDIRKIRFAELDAVARGDRGAALRKLQPAIADYLDANIEHQAMRKTVELMALAMDYVS